MKLSIINGPNLNLLGKRDVTIYGNIPFKEYFTSLIEIFPALELSYFQSNIEGELIDKLHEVGFSYDYILLNAGGYSHTSIAISDAISNIYSREKFRTKSLLSKNCKGVICGFGLDSYKLALEAI